MTKVLGGESGRFRAGQVCRARGDPRPVLAAAIVVDRQNTELAAVPGRVGQDVERPPLVRAQQHRHWRPAAMCPLAATTAAHRQPFRPVNPVELLFGHDHALAFQHDAHAPINEASSIGLEPMAQNGSPSGLSQKILQRDSVQHGIGQVHPAIHTQPTGLVTPTGFEPVTCPLGGDCSIHLSHGAALGSFLIFWAGGQPGTAPAACSRDRSDLSRDQQPAPIAGSALCADATPMTANPR